MAGEQHQQTEKGRSALPAEVTAAGQSILGTYIEEQRDNVDCCFGEVMESR